MKFRSFNSSNISFKTITSCILGLSMLSACGGKETPPPIEVGWFDELKGAWMQQGYGNLMEVGESTYSIYQISSVSCIKKGEWPITSLESELVYREKNSTLDLLVFEYANSDTLKRFDKLPALPESCVNGGTPSSNDPEFNFEVMWHTFNEQYAFFEKRNVEWDQIYGFYRSQINPETTEQELFNLFSQMLLQINDGHVSIDAAEQKFKSGTPAMLLQRIYLEFANQTEFEDIEDYIEYQLAVINQIKTDYLGGQVTVGANEQLAWGKLSPAVGYLMVRQMTSFAEEANDNTSDLDNLAALEPVLNEAMAQLSETHGLVIDLRLNGGGQAKAALAIAKKFVLQSTPSFTVKARFDNGFTEMQTIVLEPDSSSPYEGDVIILTSGVTASAAEIFLLSMLERGRVTLVGETTEGIFSNQLVKLLPNGWSFTLSNEVYQNMIGESFEFTGIIPDIEQTIFPLVDRESGIDSGLDTAIDLLLQKGIY